MSLPQKAPKGELEVVSTGGGFEVVGQKEHLDALAALFAQHGLPCRREGAALRFDAGADEAKVKELLEEHKNAKGS